MTTYLVHGGSMTWDELALVVLAYVLLGIVLLTGVNRRDDLVRQVTSDHRSSTDHGSPISILDVSHRYGRDWALTRIDLEILPGQLVGVIGANGAGKSTLLNILSTTEAPTSGDIVIGGVSLRADPVAVRSRVGVVAHQPLLYSHLSVMENLRFYATLFDLDRTTADTSISMVLEQVSMWDGRDTRVDRLSHGQKQRIAFARALLHNPDVLLLDEPYAGLDLVAAERLDMLLLDLQAAGHTIVLTSHDFARCYELADRLVLLESGQLTHDLNCSDISRTQAELLYREALSA